MAACTYYNKNFRSVTFIEKAASAVDLLAQNHVGGIVTSLELGAGNAPEVPCGVASVDIA